MADNAPVPEVDWTKLAQALGSLREDGSEFGSSQLAQKALEQILGPTVICSAVDHYVARLPGSELARNILWLLHPWSAMQRCYEIYHSAADGEDRTTAVELLRVVGDRRVLPWIPEFLADPDLGVQAWGASMVDQFLFAGLVQPEECETLLTVMAQHSNPEVQRVHAFIQEYLAKR